MPLILPVSPPLQRIDLLLLLHDYVNEAFDDQVGMKGRLVALLHVGQRIGNRLHRR
jgi:hypothetical protein